MERETGFEPATSTLARLHSTAELFPLINADYLTFSARVVNFFFQIRHSGFDQKPLETVPIVKTGPDRIDERSPQKEHSDAMKVDSKIGIMN